MSYYNVCPKCDACLDPGESCDCNQERSEAVKKPERMRYQTKSGRSGKVKQYAG